MAVDLYSFVDLYRRQLDATAHLLAKGAAFAAADGTPECDMLDWRLAPDMHPLAFQVNVVVNFTQKWLARAAGLEVPEGIEPTLDVAGFHAAIADAKAYLATLTPAQFAGRDDMPLTFEIMPGMSPTMPAGRWVSVFATTNVYFHVTALYAILRMKGVPLGKADMFPGGI